MGAVDPVLARQLPSSLRSMEDAPPVRDVPIGHLFDGLRPPPLSPSALEIYAFRIGAHRIGRISSASGDRAQFREYRASLAGALCRVERFVGSEQQLLRVSPPFLGSDGLDADGSAYGDGRSL